LRGTPFHKKKKTPWDGKAVYGSQKGGKKKQRNYTTTTPGCGNGEKERNFVKIE